MGNDKETAQAPLRLTRLRSQLPGAPAIMTGLNNKEMATEPLSADPEVLSMQEIRHRLPRRHPMWKPKIKLIVHPTQSAPAVALPSNEQQEPPRKKRRIILHTGRTTECNTSSSETVLPSIEQPEPPRKRRVILHSGRTPERNASASGTTRASDTVDSETDLPFVLQPEPPNRRRIFWRNGRTPLPWGRNRAGTVSQMRTTAQPQPPAAQTEPEIKTEPGTKLDPGIVTGLGEHLPTPVSERIAGV